MRVRPLVFVLFLAAALLVVSYFGPIAGTVMLALFLAAGLAAASLLARSRDVNGPPSPEPPTQ